MTEDRDKIIDEMIHWWTTREVIPDSSGRIKLDRSSTIQATIRIPTKLFNDATALAHTDMNIKNFSRLCEVLLWEKLGRSKEYLKENEE